MDARLIVKRLVVMFCGFFCISLGIALMTKADTGISAISVIPYTVSLLVPTLTYGTWVGLFNALLVLLQIALLRRDCMVGDLCMQVVFCVSLGMFVDLSMLLLGPLDPQGYLPRIAITFLGVVVTAFGAYVTLISRMGVGAGDGFARAVSKLSGLSFGACRVVCDMSMASIALVLNLAFFHSLLTIREGTIISAVFAGIFVGLFLKKLKPLEYRILPENKLDPR